MSTVVDAATADDDVTTVDDDAAPDGERRASRNPYGEAHIEVDEDELRAVSPSAWFGGVVSRLDDWARRLAYGERR